MSWNAVQQLIRSAVQTNTDLDSQSRFRRVLAGPDHKCNRYDYGGALGYKVSIGESNSIEIPFTMLESVYHATMKNGGVYNKAVIDGLYHRQLNNHGCHVHVVGAMFVLAGVAEKTTARKYQFHS